MCTGERTLICLVNCVSLAGDGESEIFRAKSPEICSRDMRGVEAGILARTCSSKCYAPMHLVYLGFFLILS